MIHILFIRACPVLQLRRAKTNKFHSHLNQTNARSYITLPCALEEEPDNKDLESAHADHQQDLDHAEVDDPLLCAADGAEVAVFAGAEVFLVPGDGRHLTRDLEERLLEGRRLLGRGALFGGK